MTLVELIKQYRKEHDLSQRQLALACDLSNGYISMLEREENPKTGQPITPTIGALKKLATGMHMTLGELLMAVDDMPIDLGDDGLSGFAKISAPLKEGGLDDMDLELARLILSLSPEKKLDAIKYLRFLASDHADG